jgi:sugar/nucleoside kinase (ribokinase family)
MDLFGRYLREQIENEQIDTRFLIPSDAQTTLAFVAIEQGEPVFAFYGEGTADTLLGVEELAATLRFGTAVAALTCTRPGADPPRRGQVTQFLGERGALKIED